jgi:hypothetical protein
MANPLARFPGFPFLGQFPRIQDITFQQVRRVITSIVQTILILLGANYFARRHSLLFVSGLAIGVIFDQQVNDTVQKVQRIFQANLLNKLAMGFFFMLTLPIALDFLTFGFSAKLASALAIKSRPPLDENV